VSLEQPLSAGRPGLNAPVPAPLGRLAFAALFVLLGFLAATCYALWIGSHGAPWPWNDFMYDSNFSGEDLFISVRVAAHLNPYFYKAMYCPFTYLVLHAFRDCLTQNLFSGYLRLSEACYILVSGLAAYMAFGRSWTALAAAFLLSVIALASYPLQFALDRGNLEALLGVVCFLSVLLLYEDRPIAAALVLSLAIAVKIYPVALCVLFWARGQRKAAVLAVLAAFGLTVLGLVSLVGGLGPNVLGMLKGLEQYREGGIRGLMTMKYCADPYNFLRVIGIGFRAKKISFLSTVLPNMVRFYPVFSIPAAVACSSYALWSTAPFHRRLLAVTLVLMLFPYAANDYKLVYLISVLWFMAVAPEPWTRLDRVAFLALCLLLIPKNYLFLYLNVSFSCLISPLLMMGLLATLALDRGSWPAKKAA
jgi:hypothetical protein